MKKSVFLLVLLLAAWPGRAAAPAQDGLRLVKDSKGVQVYTRPVEGSDLLEFVAVTEVEAPMAVLAEVLKDIENYPAWMSKCEKATVIQDLGGGSFLIHYVQSMPWPVTNRDVVLLADTRFLPESGRMEVTLAAAPDSAPPDKDFVRMTSFAGHMELTWLSRNQTRVRFTMRADPAGSLPAKAVNAGALDVPYKTLLGMREMAGKEKYIQAGAVSPVRGLFEAAARKGAAR